jgi:hypothetical protein
MTGSERESASTRNTVRDIRFREIPRNLPGQNSSRWHCRRTERAAAEERIRHGSCAPREILLMEGIF